MGFAVTLLFFFQIPFLIVGTLASHLYLLWRRKKIHIFKLMGISLIVGIPLNALIFFIADRLDISGGVLLAMPVFVAIALVLPFVLSQILKFDFIKHAGN